MTLLPVSSQRLRRLLPLVLALPLLLAVPVRAEDEGIYHLPIGDPARRDREAPVVLDAVTDTHTGELLTPGELPARLAEVDLLFVGESHTNVDFHRVQQRVIEELRRSGRRVMIGLEMFPYTAQEHLDRWIAGLYTEEGFLELADWYEAWGYPWGYYRDIFLAARDHRVPTFAVNAPRDVVSAVRKKGFQDLTPEEAAHIPSEIDSRNAEHLRLFKAYFDADDPIHGQMSDEAWQSMLDAQCTWDATMAWNSVRAFEANAGDVEAGRPILVVLIGGGHVAYGLGIERQARRWHDGGMASLIPVPVRDGDGEPVASIQASYADFLWGVPPEGDPLYPSLGISTASGDGDAARQIIDVAEGSPAERAGIQTGDVLVEVDGTDVDARGTLRRLMAAKAWGDAVDVTVRRGEETLALRVLLRRTLDDADEAGQQEANGEDTDRPEQG